METLIAIPKASSFNTATLSGGDMMESFSRSLIKKGIKELPMEAVLSTSQATEIDDLPIRVNPTGFVSGQKLSAFIIQAGAKKIREAKEVLNKDFHLIPDVPLYLPGSTGPSSLGTRSATTSPWPADSGVAKAHRDGIKGGNVIVAVLDTGCDADHVQFDHTEIDFAYFPPTTPHVVRSIRGFDPNGHGTHVCGIIAGKAIGVAPDATLMVGSVIESEKTQTSLMRIVTALGWIVEKASLLENHQKSVILNMSLGFKQSMLAEDTIKTLMNGMHDLLNDMLLNYNILPIVAIGNEGAATHRYPGAFPKVVGVGAVNTDKRPSSFSGGGNISFEGNNYNKPDLVGYGESIYSSFYRDIKGHSKYAEKSGTSMATPYVAGIAALLAQKYQLQGDALRRKLFSTVLPLDESTPDRVGLGLARFQ